ncbi:MAG: hypothetical protein ACLTFB_02255 [Candidatus Phytoplasma pyri]|uniref:hypothetical protein n=1 Tax=Candidatus Phytoplasma pyri TaxID=47566 RepID=UPI0039835787
MKKIFNKKFYFLNKFFIILILFFINYNQNILYICAAVEEKELTKNIDLSIEKNLEKEKTPSKPEKINQNNNKMYAFFEVITSKNQNKINPSVNFLSMSELPETSNSQNTNNPFYNEINLSSVDNINPEVIVTTTSNNNFKYKNVLKYLLLSAVNIFFGSVVVFFINYFI